MARTQTRSEQIADDGIFREDMNITISGKSVVVKLVAGTGIQFSSSGADPGTGEVTIEATGQAVGVSAFLRAYFFMGA